ncbi:hypothetical protein AB0F81_02720 [Actinoplanes sp. NPDC024001]|uniref:hypothetical protein n=1 Tax=Actinoplanes sp. NPDC024001 TaxID=3154598 RepID=UPI0033FC7FD4
MVTSVGALAPTVTVAAPPSDPSPAQADSSSVVDDLPNPLEDKRRALREQAISQVLTGESKVETRNGSKVVNLRRTYGNGAESVIKPQLGDPVFHNKDKYFFEELPNHGVKLPAVGVKIAVLSQVGTSMTVAVY